MPDHVRESLAATIRIVKTEVTAAKKDVIAAINRDEAFDTSDLRKLQALQAALEEAEEAFRTGRKARRPQPRAGRAGSVDRVKRGADDHVAASALRAPILESLRELGGAAQSEDVLDRVATKVVLQPNDTRGTKNRPDIPRWKNSAAWVRYELTKNGYVALDTTKRGRWKLTAKGEDLLDAMTGQA